MRYFLNLVFGEKARGPVNYTPRPVIGGDHIQRMALDPSPVPRASLEGAGETCGNYVRMVPFVYNAAYMALDGSVSGGGVVSKSTRGSPLVNP